LRTKLVRDLGPAVSPFNSFLLLQGIETLCVRMQRHVSNAQAVAEWLEEQPQSSVCTTRGSREPLARAAKQYLPEGVGAVLAFEVKGGLDAGRRFVGGVSLFSHLANIATSAAW